MTIRKWTRAELARLRELRPTHSLAECAKLLGRSYAAVTARVGMLGLRQKPHWKGNDERKLQILWGDRSVEQIAKRLGRTPIGILLHARKLGLEIGCPQGFEYLGNAARRTGFGVAQFYAIVVATGYIASVRPSFTVHRDGGYRYMVIESDTADAAVAKWMATEPILPAARRRHVCVKRLKRLVEAELGPRPFGGRKHWRVPTEVIDRVLAEDDKRRAA